MAWEGGIKRHSTRQLIDCKKEGKNVKKFFMLQKKILGHY